VHIILEDIKENELISLLCFLLALPVVQLLEVHLMLLACLKCHETLTKQRRLVILVSDIILLSYCTAILSVVKTISFD